jgi:serine/threonine protein phosphatase PrpC
MSHITSIRDMVQQWVYLVLLFQVSILGIHADECPPYGCSMVPRDILLDDSIRQSLATLRRSSRNRDKSSVNDPDLSCGNDFHATLTMIGYKGGKLEHQINQDRAFVLNPFMTNHHLSGVFDGHGRHGEIVAEYSRQEFPKRLAQKIHSLEGDITQDSIVTILKDTFLEIDRDARSASQGKGGCTASIVLRIEDYIFVANAGDSISIVATCNLHNSEIDQNSSESYNTIHMDTTKDSHTGTHVHFVTREDKPHLQEERSRIEAMGGRVWIPPDLTQESSRVLFVDPTTGYQTGLAMSRSIGDWDMIGVIAEPVVTVFSVSSILCSSIETKKGNDESCTVENDSTMKSKLFVVSATDGLMDYVDTQTLAESFTTSFCDKSLHPLSVAEELIFVAANGWHSEMKGEYRDDIAVAASMLV